MKESGPRIRIERQLREKFLATCREQDRPAAQVIREFMRAHIQSNEPELGDKLRNKRQADV